MLGKIPSLNKLILELGRIPGVGPKSAQRMAYHLMRAPLSQVESLRESLKAVKLNVKECPQCFAFVEGEKICEVCSDLHRREDLLCIVEDPSDIDSIENSGVFNGRYHVLHGAISPLDGIQPEDLKIPALLHRLDEPESKIKEVILALDADLEGDTTVLYLAKLLKQREISAYRIAHGVPIGGDIDYIDHRTLGRAIENKVQV
ncbi:MAG TPA: recombination protein RecR [Bdellovibrionales bacterium]|nr:recombination protein RecR [Pseudobdellovibrionaceae bacterium]HAG90678.1 recombination protein RecR [Bdellovibrionales bacterium]|tara:strand:+ start:29700 stop:30308 length:609 start_codon:yes stop_codon:yes gene_type:complete